MSAIEIVGIIGELFSWIGVLSGMPLLVAGLISRAVDRGYVPTTVSFVDDLDDNRFAVWTTGGRTCTRALTAHEVAMSAESATVTGFASPHDPERMRFEQTAPATRVLVTLAAIMLGAAVLGFLASLLPMFV